MASKSLVLILGAGPRIGISVAEKFAQIGYNVAIASRSGAGTRTAQGFHSLQADFADPASIPALFDAVRAEFHTSPSVVVYNAAALTPPPEKDSPLSIPVSAVQADLNVNTVSAYAAAQQTLRGWETLPQAEDASRAFIYTGNGLNTGVPPVAMFTNLGTGKSASAYWLGASDALYADKGYRFFYADERFADGRFKAGEIDGPAHAEFYAELAKGPKNVPWDATFVKDKGYVKFGSGHGM